MSTMAATLKAAAPRQLTFSSTEGYFKPGDPSVSNNPGAGGQCDGEDWSQEVGYFDVATAHIYYRSVKPH